ncbi:hypothetical protein PMN64_03855 [Bradyrhizobium sp. UFLA01-814]
MTHDPEQREAVFMLEQKASAPKDVNDVLMQRVALAGNLAY